MFRKPTLAKTIAIKLALRRPAPLGIAQTDQYIGLEAAFLKSPDSEYPAFKITDQKQRYYDAIAINENGERGSCCIPFDFSDNLELSLRRWEQDFSLRYDSEWDYIYSKITLHLLRRKMSEKFAQKSFNRRARFLRDRIDLLAQLIELGFKDVSEPNWKYDNRKIGNRFFLFGQIYGERAYGHPKFEEEDAYFDFLIGSFIEEKVIELRDDGDLYLSPKALVIIADHQESERRHLDNVRLNRILVVLTFFIAIGTLLAAFS